MTQLHRSIFGSIEELFQFPGTQGRKPVDISRQNVLNTQVLHTTPLSKTTRKKTQSSPGWKLLENFSVKQMDQWLNFVWYDQYREGKE